ncbi:MAG: stage III sporulation protein AG [Lachnospiraceae bacterium]|nr:stage III sporulation protein AG [Lachnospiraceae bacterium]
MVPDEKNSREKKILRVPFQLTKDNFLIMILVGVLLLVIAWPVGDSSKEESKVGDMSGFMDYAADEEGFLSEEAGILAEAERDGAGSIREDDMLSYAAYLESALEELLSDMDGAGRVKVMITMESSKETVLEKDVVSLREGTTEVDSAGGSRNTTHISNQEETVFSEAGSSLQTPYVKKVNAPRVQGVVVAAEGGQDTRVAKNITEAIQALFGIEAHKIKVVKMNSR